jgi:hypothetical protein
MYSTSEGCLLLRNATIHQPVLDSLQLDSTLNQLNFLHVFTKCFSKIHSNIVRTDVLMAVNMKNTVIWDVTPCNLVRVYRRFGGTVSSSGPLFDFKCGSSIFFRNVSKFLPDYSLVHPRIHYSLLYAGESVNRSQMDVKSKTSDIRTREKHLFLDISSTYTDTLVPSLYQCVETRSIQVF